MHELTCSCLPHFKIQNACRHGWMDRGAFASYTTWTLTVLETKICIWWKLEITLLLTTYLSTVDFVGLHFTCVHVHYERLVQHATKIQSSSHSGWVRHDCLCLSVKPPQLSHWKSIENCTVAINRAKLSWQNSAHKCTPCALQTWRDKCVQANNVI